MYIYGHKIRAVKSFSLSRTNCVKESMSKSKNERKEAESGDCLSFDIVSAYIRG